nr:methyl-cpg-binding domain-containing protein 8 [Ipomoea batatas]
MLNVTSGLCGVNSTTIVTYIAPEMHGEDGVNNTAIVTYIAPEMHGEEILPEGTNNPVGGIQIHDRKTRSGGYRNRPPLTDGMIMKDGKYGCQFCPKVFDRLTSYTGHVGIHLRRNLKGSSTSIEAAPRAAKTYYGKDPRGARVRFRPRAYSRVGNLKTFELIFNER